MGPIQGIKVIELAHIMAGPTCGMMLADMGADVIKVEKVPGGDDARHMVPPEVDGESAAFMMMNRNKRGIAINLKTNAGRTVLTRLIRDADVLIENYRKGTMEKLGLGYDVLFELNPGLIHCEISGFGRTGPYADRGGFDLIAQGMAGLMSITGEGPGREPVKCGAPMTDITAGILGAMAILGAYIHRLRTGEGQRVDTSLFEAGIAHTFWQSAIAFATGQAPMAMGSAHPLTAPYQAFQTQDGWITVGAANQKNWIELIKVLDAESLQEDPRFQSNDARINNLEALQIVLGKIFRTRNTAEWLQRLESSGVPAGPIQDILQMQQDPQALARGMVQSIHHSRLGPMQTLGHPVTYSRTPSQLQCGAPMYGEHTRAVLEECGYSHQQIGDLIKAGAVVCQD
ncbi:MAG: CoA transferase [Arenicellales bacterium]|nr:CoA transferase [Arenicellales bacterium]